MLMNTFFTSFLEDMVMNNDSYFYPKYTPYFKKQQSRYWDEKNDKWELVINNNDADITIDEDMITIKYEVLKDGELYYEYQQKVNFPENSNHETIKAKRENDKIVLSVDKVVIEENKARKLIIE